MSKEDFEAWGWRVPFWVSILMVGISYLIRKNMHESPLFAKAKASGNISTNPLKESFGNKFNFKFVLLALFGAVMGQGVVWYTGQFYALSYLEKIMNINKIQVDELMFVALIMGTPFFIFFGWLSDKIGRKWIMMAGMLIALLSYRSIYNAMYKTTDPSTKQEDMSLYSMDGILVTGADNQKDSIYTTQQTFTDGTKLTTITKLPLKDGKVQMVDGRLKSDVQKSILITFSDKWRLIWLVWIQVIFVTMVYGPIAAFLVEMFPVRIRYTSMSLPYHIGNGVFGGLLPAVATYLTTTSKAVGNETWYLDGLWYPIIVSGVCFIIGVIYLNGKDTSIED
jgi:MFS family permease